MLFDKLLTRLEPVRRQGEYKAVLATAMADVLQAPPGARNVLYGCSLGALHLPDWTHVPNECVVDLAFLTRASTSSPWTSVATAESEAWPKHPISLPNDDDATDAGYFWDLFKLLQYPSPYRVFLAVTNTSCRPADPLAQNLFSYAARYASVMGEGTKLDLAIVQNVDATSGWLGMIEGQVVRGKLEQTNTRLGP